MKKTVLVFPCGSEIGLEIHRSLKHSIHFDLIGGNSVCDHGQFVYEKYIEDIPFIDHPDFIESLGNAISQFKVDLLYPTMDAVISKVWTHQDQLRCQIVGSSSTTNDVCLSKRATTQILAGQVAMPEIYDSIDDIKRFPVFLKPDIGYGARDTSVAFSKDEVVAHLKKTPTSLMLEFLPGEEFTVDCFTDRKRNLLFAGPRVRRRISNGISVNTSEAEPSVIQELKGVAERINKILQLRGAWFFQAKRSERNELKVMEVAARLGGSSSLFRAKGVNFALMTLWDALNTDISIIENKYNVELDRALANKFRIQLKYSQVFADFDDTVIVNGQINTELIAFFYQCINDRVEIICITRHAENIHDKLKYYRLDHIFDRVIHLKANEAKSSFVTRDAIFIDDSFKERQQVAEALGIPVFSPDMISVLIK